METEENCLGFPYFYKANDIAYLKMLPKLKKSVLDKKIIFCYDNERIASTNSGSVSF